MKQTATEWLAEKYNYITWLRNRDEVSSEQGDSMRTKYLLEAKEMEKEQMKSSYEDGKRDAYKQDDVPTAEEYVYQKYGL